MLSHVAFTSLPVLNLDRAIAFWRDTMGLVLAADVPDPAGGRWVTMQIPNAPTLIHLNQVAQLPAAQMPALSLVAPNVAAFAQNLASLGVQIVQPTMPAAWDATVQTATFRDTEGNLILLTSR